MCNTLGFKLIYEGFEGVATGRVYTRTCMNLYLRLHILVISRVYLLYLLITRETPPQRKLAKNVPAKKIPRRKILDPFNGD